jgi:hypothetical protein
MSVSGSTRIKVVCACGKKYLVRAELEGKRGKCKCGNEFTVPKKETKPVARTKKCPWCSSMIGLNKVSCKDCERRALKSSLGKPGLPVLDGKIAITLVTTALLVLVCGIWQSHLNETHFYLLYWSFLTLCFLGAILTRVIGCTRKVVTVIALGFIALGAIRYSHGMTQGIQQFHGLRLMMVFGTIAIALAPFIDLLLGGIEKRSEESHLSNCSGAEWGNIRSGYSGPSITPGYGSHYVGTSGFMSGGCTSSNCGGCGG